MTMSSISGYLTADFRGGVIDRFLVIYIKPMGKTIGFFAIVKTFFVFYGL